MAAICGGSSPLVGSSRESRQLDQHCLRDVRRCFIPVRIRCGPAGRGPPGAATSRASSSPLLGQPSRLPPKAWRFSRPGQMRREAGALDQADATEDRRAGR